jgi:hypothetical protein
MRTWLFRLAAGGFVLGGISHVAALFEPSVLEPSPPWRHGLFVAINLIFAAGMLMRPAWLIFLLLPLTAQQLFSHGIDGWRVWHEQGRVDWASVVVLLGMPALTALVAHDLLSRRRAVEPGP